MGNIDFFNSIQNGDYSSKNDGKYYLANVGKTQLVMHDTGRYGGRRLLGVIYSDIKLTLWSDRTSRSASAHKEWMYGPLPSGSSRRMVMDFDLLGDQVTFKDHPSVVDNGYIGVGDDFIHLRLMGRGFVIIDAKAFSHHEFTEQEYGNELNYRGRLPSDRYGIVVPARLETREMKKYLTSKPAGARFMRGIWLRPTDFRPPIDMNGYPTVDETNISGVVNEVRLGDWFMQLKEWTFRNRGYREMPDRVKCCVHETKAEICGQANYYDEATDTCYVLKNSIWYAVSLSKYVFEMR